MSGGWTALFYALERKDKLLVEFLLKNGAGMFFFVLLLHCTAFVIVVVVVRCYFIC